MRDLREENYKLNQKIDELTKIEREKEDINNQLIDLQLVASSYEKKLKILEEDLEQARCMSQVSGCGLWAWFITIRNMREQRSIVLNWKMKYHELGASSTIRIELYVNLNL